MMTVSASTLKIQNPQHRQERVKNDLKHSWATGATVSAGAIAGVALYEDPALVKKGYDKAAKYATTKYAEAKNTSFGKAVGEKIAQAVNFVKNKAVAFSKTGFYAKVKNKIAPAINKIKPKWGNLKTQVLELVKNGKKALDKVPAKYRALGAVALATLGVLAHIFRSHAYNEGKIDGRYEK